MTLACDTVSPCTSCSLSSFGGVTFRVRAIFSQSKMTISSVQPGEEEEEEEEGEEGERNSREQVSSFFIESSNEIHTVVDGNYIRYNRIIDYVLSAITY